MLPWHVYIIFNGRNILYAAAVSYMHDVVPGFSVYMGLYTCGPIIKINYYDDDAVSDLHALVAIYSHSPVLDCLFMCKLYYYYTASACMG